MVGPTIGLPHMIPPPPPPPPPTNQEPPEDNIHRKRKKYTIWLSLEEEDGTSRFVVADESYAFEVDELTARDIWRRMDDRVLMEVPDGE